MGVGNVERERLRAETTRLLNVLRSTTVPHELFELLEVMSARLDRIELGTFEDNERPTAPDASRRASSDAIQAFRGAVELAKGNKPSP